MRRGRLGRLTRRFLGGGQRFIRRIERSAIGATIAISAGWSRWPQRFVPEQAANGALSGTTGGSRTQRAGRVRGGGSGVGQNARAGRAVRVVGGAQRRGSHSNSRD